MTAIFRKIIRIEAVRVFQTEMVPAIHIEFVDVDLHPLGIASLLAAGKRKLSLVDCVSFEIMRRLGLKHVFVFDAHFKGQGFDTLPQGQREWLFASSSRREYLLLVSKLN